MVCVIPLLHLLLVNPITPMDPSTTLKIEELVRKRTEYRLHREYLLADQIKSELENDFQVVLKDFPFREGGHTTWTPKRSLPRSDSEEPSLMTLIKLLPARSNKHELLASIKHKLRMAIEEFEVSLTPAEKPLDEREMLGRKFADAALHLALAGVEDEEIYADLVKGCVFELRRIGMRSSCRSVDICQMMERMAAAGIRNVPLFELAGNILQRKSLTTVDSANDLLSGEFSLLHSRPLNVLYQITSKQHKFGNQFFDSAHSIIVEDDHFGCWEDVYRDPSLPLILDLGCGYGVNLIALASKDMELGTRFNFLGCDLSPQALTYARGISFRWSLASLAFIRCSALTCIERLRQYSGPVVWAFLNFPTPYRLDVITSSDEFRDLLLYPTDAEDDVIDGNKQLPRSLDEFMVTKELMNGLANLFVRNISYPYCGLLVQSNVEDVALVMERLARGTPKFNTSSGFRPVKSPHEAELFWSQIWDPKGSTYGETEEMHEWFTSVDDDCLRQKRWKELGGKRVDGAPWLPRSPLKNLSRTETEVAYQLEDKPVYRTVFIRDSSSN